MSDSEESSISSEESTMSGEGDGSNPVFGPHITRAELPPPLGKKVRLRIDLEGARGLPQTERSSPDFIAHLPVAKLLEISELLLWDNEHTLETSCTLCLSTFQACNNAGRQDDHMRTTPNTWAQEDDLHAGGNVAHSAPTAWTTNSLHTILCQLSTLMQTVDLLKVDVNDRDNTYWIQLHIYTIYERSLKLKLESSHPRVDVLISSMVSTMSAILPVASTSMQQRDQLTTGIVRQLFWSALIMGELVDSGESEYQHRTPEVELARLTWLIVTPAPTIGASSTSANSSQHVISGTITKDALLFVLEAIVESSDAFGPLKSAASGLLYFVASAEMASSNKKQVRDIYRRIDSLSASLKRGVQDGGSLSPVHQDAITALARDIALLTEDLEDIVKERKSRFKRFFSAKRHQVELQDVLWQLDNARVDYTTAIATLNATTNTQVLAHVKALTLVMGVQPAHMLGTRRADAVTFPPRTSRIEEV